MAPRRAAAVSAASSISQAAGPSSHAQSGKEAAQGRQSLDAQKQSTKAPPMLPIIPIQPLSPIVIRLRKMWKFAAICQFLFTFDEAFGMSGFETEALEKDLDGTERKVIPDLMRRLLYTLTLNMTIDEHNWEDHLRAQYLKRHPEETMLGTVEDPFPWSGLPLRQKVETLHQACEWQLWDAERFRKLVKNDEDAHIWRIDPIGWDALDNTYWLFDDNRLWIQHPRPTPPKTKAPPKKNSKKAKLEAAAAKRAAQPTQKRKREDVTKPRSTPTRSSARNRTSSNIIEKPMLKRGRTSRRSTGKDGWEEIPAELLYGGGGKGRVMKDDDEDSDLSDPPPVEDEDVSMVEASKVKENGVHFDESVTADMSVDVQDQENSTVINGEGEEGDDTEAKQEGEVEVKEETMEKEEEKEKEQPVKEEEEEEWIEFETIAVTKQEWEAISLQFAKSKHPDEKSLHQLIKQEVLPKVMADLEEAEKQRAHEAAMANRKRSSRIALKESEREEKERDRVARLKMEERMATIRAEEAQQVAKEKEEKNLARVREERLREREERMLARERELIEKAEREMMERENREKLREMRKLKREQILANGGVINESEELQQRKEADEDSWELDCEVCGKAGINLDDDTDEIVCCETCGKWQHTECWNTFDRSIGQPIRDWEKEDFFCSTCKPPAEGQLRPRRPIKQDQSAAAPLPAASMAGLSQAKAPPNSIEASSILKQHSIPSSVASMQPNIYNNHYNARPSLPSSYSQIEQRSPQHQGGPQQQSLQHQSNQYSSPQSLQYRHSQIPSPHQYPSQSPTPYQPHSSPPSSYHPQQSQSPSPHQQYSQLQSYHQQQFHHPQQQFQQRQTSPYSQQQQQQQQPTYPQTPQYATSGRGYTNGYPNLSHAQSPQRGPVVQSQIPPQIPPQHMQRPPPMQSPVTQQSASQQTMLQHAAHGSQRPSPPTPTNGTRMDMPAPLPTFQGSSNASSGNNTKSIAASSSGLAPIVSPGNTLPNPTSPQGPNTTTASLAVSPGPAKSPSPSPKVSPSVPRILASLPSGSFPLRHSMARSPLSRPEGYTSPSIPKMTLGPSAGRATSPSPIKKSPTSSSTLDPLLNRQTVVASSNLPASLQGPGPSTGSLARAPLSSGTSQPASSALPSVQTSVQTLVQGQQQQQHAKSLGPSPSRPVFGADFNRPTQPITINAPPSPAQNATAVSQPTPPQTQQLTTKEGDPQP